MRFRRSTFAATYVTAASVLSLMVSPASAETSPQTQISLMLDHTKIEQAIGGITTELRDAYVFPEIGAKAADALQSNLEAKVYAGVTDPAQFARQLTEQLRALTSDSHMRVIYGLPFGDQSRTSEPQGAGLVAERLEGNVEYINLPSFVPPDIFHPAADEAIRKLLNTAAIIIDMRDNGGGHPASVAYLISFFLDQSQPVHLNDLIWRNRGTSTFRTEAFFSSPTPVTYLDQPVYVLVGPQTYSAGEEFSYDLHVLKRAVIVGEASRGGANPGGLNELGSDLFVIVPTGRAENPITRSNWGGKGVLPDVQTTSEAALKTALALAVGKS